MLRIYNTLCFTLAWAEVCICGAVCHTERVGKISTNAEQLESLISRWRLIIHADACQHDGHETRSSLCRTL